ncbi:MAG: hypothetical protein F4X57_13855 [Chloroflexi bacterium]|nr:hypothetical protein [Chloroflexota bacterium]
MSDHKTQYSKDEVIRGLVDFDVEKAAQYLAGHVNTLYLRRTVDKLMHEVMLPAMLSDEPFDADSLYEEVTSRLREFHSRQAQLDDAFVRVINEDDA